MQIAVICGFVAFFHPLYNELSNKNVADRSVFAKRFSISGVKFGKTKSLSKNELCEFEQLCSSGSFGRFCLPVVSIVNNRVFETWGYSGTGRVRRSWRPFPRTMIFEYDPFNETLYMSDDWDDDYSTGLTVSNMPHRLVRFPEWDDQYPRWMETNVDDLKQHMTNSVISVKVCAFTRPPNGVSGVYRYFIPYMHATFGARVNLLSDQVVCKGKIQEVVDNPDMNRRPDEIDITIGNTTIQTDWQNIKQFDFFNKLTNALMHAADCCVASNAIALDEGSD